MNYREFRTYRQSEKNGTGDYTDARVIQVAQVLGGLASMNVEWGKFKSVVETTLTSSFPKESVTVIDKGETDYRYGWQYNPVTGHWEYICVCVLTALVGDPNKDPVESKIKEFQEVTP